MTRSEGLVSPKDEYNLTLGLRWNSFRRWIPLLVVLTTLSTAHAIIFYSTADPNYNTTAPTGALANSGWQWVGQWGGFQGTPIGPHHFLAARHVGGTVGDALVLEGMSYPTTAFYDDAASDLRIWEIAGTFPSWAPIYRGSDEVGRTLVVFGRGLIRGGEVRDPATNKLRGWYWGTNDGRMRWGQNVVASSLDGVDYWGSLLYATFDASGGSNEAHLATGDSSGPVFINDGSGWKLAGIAATVDAYFNTTTAGAGFIAAIFDARELYYGTPGSWTLVTGQKAVPSGFYGTRVSVRANWIDGIVLFSGSETSSDAPLLTPASTAALAVILFATGAFFLTRAANKTSPRVS